MDYPRPIKDSGLGIHAGSNAWYPTGEDESRWQALADEWWSMGIRWVKVLATGNTFDSALRALPVLTRKGLFPIVRFMYPHNYPVTITPEFLTILKDDTRRYRDQGVF